MTADPIQIDCLTSFEEVDYESWEALWHRDPHAHFYQKYGWYAAWIRHFAPDESPLILVVRRGDLWLGAAAMIVRVQEPAPLVSRKVLTFLSSFSSAYPLYQGPLVDPEHEADVLDAMARAIIERNGFCAVNFELYTAGSPAEKLLEAVERISGRPRQQQVMTQSHLVEWTGDYEDYIASLGSKTRRNVRSYSRHFLEASDAHRLQVAEASGDMLELVEAIREQKRRRFIEMGQQSNFDQDCFLDFLKDLAPNAQDSGNALGLMARIGERIIGTQLVFLDEHGHFFSYNSSFDSDYKDLRIHYLLESQRVRLALEKGYSLIDLSTGHDDHKRHWTGGKVRDLFDGEVVLRPLANAGYGAYARLKKTVKNHLD